VRGPREAHPLEGRSSALFSTGAPDSQEYSRAGPLETVADGSGSKKVFVSVKCILSYTLAEEEKPRTGAKPENTMPPAAAPFLAWPPLLLHPWAPALLPGAWCSSAAVIRSALPG
ncbi:hypothetical protein ILUMI_25544, partial [Ignelater luminosus]